MCVATDDPDYLTTRDQLGCFHPPYRASLIVPEGSPRRYPLMVGCFGAHERALFA